MAPWDLLQTLSEPSDNVQGAAFVTVEGTEYLIVVENSDGTGYVYTDDGSGTWTVDTTFSTSQTVWGVRGSPTGEFIALSSSNNNLVEVRETSGWTVETTVAPVSESDPVYNGYGFSNNGDLLGVGDDTGNFSVYRTSDWSVAFSDYYTYAIQRIAFDPTDSYLIVPSRTNAAIILDTSDWSQYTTIPTSDNGLDGVLRGSGWSQDGTMFGIGDDSGLFNIYDIESTDYLYSLSDPGSERAQSLYFFNDDATAVHTNQDGAYVHEHDSGTDSWSHTATMDDFTPLLNDRDISSDRGLLIFGSASPEAYLYEAIPDAPIVSPISGTVTLNGTPQEGATVYIIDTSTNSIVATLTTDANGEFSYSATEDGPFHVTVQHDDGTAQYNAESLPYIQG